MKNIFNKNKELNVFMVGMGGWKSVYWSLIGEKYFWKVIMGDKVELVKNDDRFVVL